MKAIKTGIVIVFFLLFFSSCDNVAGVVHKCENIEDEQIRELCQKYFDDEERAFIFTHFKNAEGRYLLGETYTNGNRISYIKLYDDVIEDYADEIGYPFKFVRGDIIIHELCHVLFPNENHSEEWLNSYKQKLEKYCTDSKSCLIEYYKSTSRCIDVETYLETLIECYIDLSTSDYE